MWHSHSETKGEISLDDVTSLKDTEEEDHPHDAIGARHHGHDLSLVAVVIGCVTGRAAVGHLLFL
jgi:hypothetical protein